MISVLVVDDSVVMRRLITDALATDPAIRVVGTAENGELGLAEIERLRPDIITLDIEMPVLNGIGTLRKLRPKYPRLPVVMFSTLTAEGATATLDALTAGASDYVTKPSNNSSFDESLLRVREQIIPRIHALCAGRGPLGEPVRSAPSGFAFPPAVPGLAGIPRTDGAPVAPVTALAGGPGAGRRPTPGRVAPESAPESAAAAGTRPTSPAGPVAPPNRPGPTPARSTTSNVADNAASVAARMATITSPSPPPGRPATSGTGGAMRTGKVDVLAVGCSTGGPEALGQVLRAMPANLPVPVVVVQHMPAVFTRMFAERLDRSCALTVVEATADMPVRPGTVYIAPGDFHLEVIRSGATVVTRLHTGPPENFCRPAVDVLFRSVAQVYGGNVVATILTGMGHDGRGGAEILRAAGAEIVAQDEATSVVWGMPGAVAQAGLAHSILPLGQIAGHLLARASGRSVEVSR